MKLNDFVECRSPAWIPFQHKQKPFGRLSRLRFGFVLVLRKRRSRDEEAHAAHKGEGNRKQAGIQGGSLRR